jgi:hypothetical protein
MGTPFDANPSREFVTIVVPDAASDVACCPRAWVGAGVFTG